jgi:aminomethyltransferase
MADFAGWDMPIQYSNITDEHRAVRTGLGIFDISHMGRLNFDGADALALIQQVYTNNAATMKEGQVRYGLVCNPAGGILDDVLVYRWPTNYAMVVNASNREKILAWLAAHQAGRDVRIEDQTFKTCMVAVQGPKALTACQGLTPADAGKLSYYFATPSTYRGQPCVVSRTGYTGEDGLEITVGAAQGLELWEELLGRSAVPCGLGARDTLRLEAAMPLYGHELDEETDPLQAGLGWAVKLDKGDFIGRDALVRRQADSTVRRRVGLVLDGKRIAREGAAVLAEGRTVGKVTSGTFAPTLQQAVAMAYVESALTAVGTVVQADIRGKPETARVVALPFYRRPRG